MIAVDFRSDVAPVIGYFEACIREAARDRTAISAIDLGFRLCQAGIVVLSFDRREKHESDGEWTNALDGFVLDLPHWQEAYESAGESGLSVTLTDGSTTTVAPRAGDAKVAGLFGDFLHQLVMKCLGSGMFNSLPLREDCQLDLNEFDFMWAWPAEYDDVGKTNFIRELIAR